ncbi:ubiquitin-conjugating enzyme E2 S-like [Tubulanus polymorphus]|uniref:ubiquitin-conjugating enzyme E2 S-like n=1 Tax=Tubulanus polymorphus TaxID=672921 RepID=UPI003DA369A6
MSTSNVENFSPQIIRRIVKELQELTNDPPEGIKISFNDEDITDIQATIDGPAGTPYAGGHFRMKLVLGKNFPAEPPKGFFVTKIFHPNVSKNGEICVNTLKKDWKADLGIKHILLTVKCLLIVPNPESALNEEAGKLLQEKYDDYSQRAKMYTEIHAKPLRQSNSPDNVSASTSTSSSLTEKCCEGPMAKKHAGDKKLIEKKKKDKKKTLKRL